MSAPSTSGSRGGVNVVFLGFAVILIPPVLSVGQYFFGEEEPSMDAFLEAPSEPGEVCVDGRSPVFMRYHHYEFLKDLRDDVLRDGKRGGIRLQDCRMCHESRAAFCDRCHEAVNLTPDCWNCHSYP
jgi:hypothetical protein